MSKDQRDHFNHCVKCHLHKSQWGSPGCDHTNCEHESIPIPRISKKDFLEKAARAYKWEQLKYRQQILGKDIMDEIAMKLNSEPCREDRIIVNRIWEIFEQLGAKYFEQTDHEKMAEMKKEESK